ncbi:MAG: response regulator [Calditrichaceae bacterium]|nr:response regulator [Calditrichaceae bacterium]
MNRFERRRSVFQHFAHNTHNPQSLSTNTIYALYEDRQGILWIGTESGGLNKFDRKSGAFHTFKNARENPQSLSANTIYSLREDLQGTLWIGTSGPIGGLNRFDRERETFKHFEVKRHDPTTLSSRTIFSLCVDRSGVLWIGTFDKGLNRYERQTQTFKRYQHDPRNPASLSTNTIYSIYEDSQGILWVGTLNGGLNRFDREKEEFYPFKHDPENPETLSNNTILCIYEDRSGVLWLGTDGGGLNRFGREREAFFSYGLADGLPHLSINGILEDNQGNLWLSTGNGISRFNPRNKTFKNYDIRDGLQSNTFNFGAFCKSRSGEMIFGGINGFNIFNPEDIKDNFFVPPIVFTAFVRYSTEAPGEKAFEEKGISEREEIELSYKNNILTFEFAALSFQQAGKNQYAYKLEGFNNHWIKLGTKHDVTFTNLDPGEYTLYVKGSNDDGVWNEEGTSLKITILPPWWKTWWAYTLYALLAFGLLYGIRRFELNRQRLKHDLELEHLEREKVEEVDRLKSRFFANISHEFRTPLTLIQGPVQQLRSGEFKGNIKEQYDLILRNCNRLLRLINQLLDLSKLESGSMKLQARPENIVELTRQLTMAFESLAKRKRIQLSFRASADEITAYIDRDKFEKIVTNLLSNAFKFTGKGGKVMVAVNISPGPPSKGGARPVSLPDGREGLRGMLEIHVKDAGVGIPAEHLPHIFERFFQVNDFGEGETLHATSRQGTGIGLALTKELVELHHGKILVTSEVGKGTTCTVRLPLGKEHLKPDQIVEIGGEITVGAKHPLQSIESHTEEFAGDASPQHPLQSIESHTKEFAGDASPQQPLQSIESHTEEFAGDASPQQPLQSIESHTEEFAGDASPLHYQSSNRPITQSPNILIVEDNPDMRAYIHNSLKNKYTIAEAENGAEGFKKALKAGPDLIVSDVMMPKMDGYQFCEKIKTDPRTSHIPVILLTAKASRGSKLEGLETGADDYLTKPFDAEELRVRIKNLIEQRRKLRELFQRELKVEPQELTVTSADEKFLRRAMEIVEENIGNSEFDTVALSREIGLGRSQLNIKLRALTGYSTREFIRTLRLKRAARLLQQRFGNVAEVAYEVGFNSLSHFSKAFTKQFGVLPSGYGTKPQSREKG